MAMPVASFGRSGHASSRLVFGAAALARVTQAEAERALPLLFAHGVNHIDTAASYGDAELRLAPWLARHRERFFLATKTGERTRAGAAAEIRRSLERMGVETIDLIQLHNLVKPDEQALALGPDGALRAALDARDAGLVRLIGITGHGTRVAAMHLSSLARFDFDSVLLPYSAAAMRDPEYAADFERLLASCVERNVAVQTIKSVARRRWPEGAAPTHATWYEPLSDPAEIERAVHWALARPKIFVNTAGDLALLEPMLRAGESFAAAPRASEVPGTEPLFARGFGAAAAP
jgi:aryl-alcohol dehydrogenase-like predicted oxidoreductase